MDQMLSREMFFKTMDKFQLLYNHAIKPELAELYWKHFKNTTQHRWLIGCERVANTFIPTAVCPFPVIAHFNHAVPQITDNL